MCAAQKEPVNESLEEIHLIHEAEAEARMKIEEAERRAKEIRSGTEKEIHEIDKKYDEETKAKIQSIMNDVEKRKKIIEKRANDEAELEIENLEKKARKKMKDVVDFVVKVIIGESEV